MASRAHPAAAQRAIRLRYEIWDVPLQHNEYQLVFEPQSRGYIVLAQDFESDRMVPIRRSTRTLTWRLALNDIRSLEEAAIALDDPILLSVRGLLTWQADMLRIAACRAECDDTTAGFLGQFDDDTLARVAARIGRLASEPVLELVRRLEDIAKTTGASTPVMRHWILRTRRAQVRDPDEWCEMVEEHCSARPRSVPTAP